MGFFTTLTGGDIPERWCQFEEFYLFCYLVVHVELKLLVSSEPNIVRLFNHSLDWFHVKLEAGSVYNVGIERHQPRRPVQS